MVLVLIFAGSFLGLFAGAVQVVLHGAPIWPAVALSFGLALGLPLALGCVMWLINRVMPRTEHASDAIYFRN